MDEVQKKTAELNKALELLTQSYDDTLEALGSALGLKDAETEGLSLPKMLCGANAFEISDIEKMKIGTHQSGV